MSNLVPARERIKSLRALFEKAKSAIAEVLPRHLTPERIARVTLAAVSRTPLLLECEPRTILQSVMVAAQLGLEPTGVLGSAYLVPYRNGKTGKYEAQLIIGYRGLIDLARRSGQILSIEARLVRRDDRFRCQFGLSPVLEHEPNWESQEAEVTHIYAVAHLTGGGTQFEVMTFAEIEGIRRRSKAKDSGPWQSDWEEMGRKTVVRRLSKYLPLSVEFATALEIQANAEAGEPTDYAAIADLPDLSVIDAELAEPEPTTTTEKVKEKLKATMPDASEIFDK